MSQNSAPDFAVGTQTHQMRRHSGSGVEQTDENGIGWPHLAVGARFYAGITGRIRKLHAMSGGICVAVFARASLLREHHQRRSYPSARRRLAVRRNQYRRRRKSTRHFHFSVANAPSSQTRDLTGAGQGIVSSSVQFLAQCCGARRCRGLIVTMCCCSRWVTHVPAARLKLLILNNK
jgi:hypothetical protein